MWNVRWWEVSSFSTWCEVREHQLCLTWNQQWVCSMEMQFRSYESHSVVSDSLQPHVLYSLWNSPGQDTGVGSLSLLQGIFLTQGSNPGLLHCRRILYQLSHQGRGKEEGKKLWPDMGKTLLRWRTSRSIQYLSFHLRKSDVRLTYAGNIVSVCVYVLFHLVI